MFCKKNIIVGTKSTRRGLFGKIGRFDFPSVGGGTPGGTPQGDPPGGPPGGTMRPPKPEVGGQRGEPESISQPVDPGGVGGLLLAIRTIITARTSGHPVRDR